jgi:hypothetical protein
MHRSLATTLAASLAALAAAAAAQPPGPSDPSLAGFPPGYIEDCATRPASDITAVPAPLNAYMRVVCTKVSDALAPLPGYEWDFPNGTAGFLTALNPKGNAPAGAAHFSRLAYAPLSDAEVASFRQRLAPAVTNQAILTAQVLRLEVDTSTGDHKQEYFLVAHDGAGAITGEWGIECYNDCNPMEQSPWAFTVVPARK